MQISLKNTSQGSEESVPALSEFIKPTDEAVAVARPSDIEEFYVELEHREAEEEQRRRFAEEGEIEACPFDVKAHETKEEAEKARKFSDAAEQEAQQARDDEKTAREVLGPHERRPTDSKVMKYARWAGLLVGDVAAFTGAALILGEEVFVAVLQALSVGTAIIALGAIGREARYCVSARARRREPDELTDAEKPYKAFFVGGHEGERLLKIIVGVCALGLLLIAVGILCLREQTEGMAAGLVFGLIALALGIASFCNAFDTADDVAEHLDIRVSVRKKAEQKAEKAREAPIIKEFDAATEEAASIRRAKKEAGEAAAAAIRRHLYSTLNNSSGVAGNGIGIGSRTGAVVATPETNDEEIDDVGVADKKPVKEAIIAEATGTAESRIIASTAPNAASLNGNRTSQGGH